MNDTVQFETEKYLCSIQTLQIAMTVRSYKNDKIAISVKKVSNSLIL